MVDRVDISQFAGKDTLLDLIDAGYERAVDLMLQADEQGWKAPTPCSEWQVRDLAGHFLDVSFSYLGYFKLAEKGWPSEPPKGMRVYSSDLCDAALAFRNLSQHELIARFVALTDRLLLEFRDLTEEEWTGKLIPHKYAGPLPAFVMATFILMDFTVHNWDFQKALGVAPSLDVEAANVLVPYMFVLHGICFDTDQSDGVDLVTQINIGDSEEWTCRIQNGQFTYAPGGTPDAHAVFQFEDPSEFALDAYQRFQGGTATGEPAAIKTFRNIFFTV